jgi:hypothetical protein
MSAHFLSQAARDLSTGLRDQHATSILRAEIDAEIACRYGLTRDQYRHILASFSHRSHPQAAGLCLAAFDMAKNRSLHPARIAGRVLAR